MNTKYKLLIGATLAIALLTNTIYAEGFFSGFLGGSKDGADLKSLLTHVPADTAYLLANKEAIPEKVIKSHLQKNKDLLAQVTASDLFKQASTDSNGPGKFFIALAEEYIGVMSKDKIADIGLSLEAKSVFYGYDMMPVMRMGVADKDKLMAMIKSVEKKSSYKVEFSKCGEFDCFEATNPKGNIGFSALFLKDHIAVSAFSIDKKEDLKKHLMGEADPKSSYSEANWDDFLKENNYPGYGDGFINLKSVFAFTKPLIIENMKGGLDEKSLNGCLAVAENHLDNMSEIVIGTKNIEKNVVDYELLFKTSSLVSTVLQTLANDTNIAQRSENAIFDMGLNINFTKMRDALAQYSSFLIKSGEDNNCPMIQAQDIRKSMGGLAFVMNMGLSQFNSIYASISDIQLNDKMQPEKIDAVISLGSNDPAGLVSLAGLVAPPLLSLKIPDDGNVIKLPEGLIPSGGVKTPDIFLSLSKKALNIFIGNDKPALKTHKNETPEISFSSIDFGGYIKILTNIMDGLPEAAKKSTGIPNLEILKKIGEAGGKMSSTTSADKRGLAVNYHIEY